MALTDLVYLPGHGQLQGVTTVIPATELTYFRVVGNYVDVENPNPSGTTNFPTLNVVTGSVTFWPRLPLGFTTYVENVDLTQFYGPNDYTDGDIPQTGNVTLAIAPIQARILSGQLQTINYPDSPHIHLLANSPALNLASQGVTELIYDVAFSNVTYSGAPQTISPFAFVAPTGFAIIDLSNPNLAQLPYAGPN